MLLRVDYLSENPTMERNAQQEVSRGATKARGISAISPSISIKFQLDIYKRDWPVNFQGIVGANERLRVEIVAIAANAQSEPLLTEISWDGAWVDADRPGCYLASSAAESATVSFRLSPGLNPASDPSCSVASRGTMLEHRHFQQPNW